MHKIMKFLGEAGNNLKTGIYFGFAILNDKIYNAVVSVGKLIYVYVILHLLFIVLLYNHF